MKDRNDYTWEELLEHNLRNVHNGLLEGGGKGMHGAMYMAMIHTLEWSKEQEKKKDTPYIIEKLDSAGLIEQAIKDWANGDEFIEVAQAGSLADQILVRLKEGK